MIQRDENAYFSKTKRETVQQRAYKKLWQSQESSRHKITEKSYCKVESFEILRKQEIIYCYTSMYTYDSSEA